MPAPDYRKRIPLNFAGASYTTRSRDVSMQSTVNWYPEVIGDQVVLYPTPGVTLLTSLGFGPHRGSIVFKDNAYFVSGDTLYKMDSLELITAVGTLITSSGRVSMATNGSQGDQLIIVDGANGYIYDESTLTAIVDADFPANPATVSFKDTYFIVTSTDSPLFFVSDSNDGSSWSALQFASAERNPDNIVAGVTNESDLWLLGEYTCEAWGSSSAEVPFDVYGNGLLDIGCAARDSVAKTAGVVLMLAKDETGQARFVAIKGLDWSIISNTGLEYILSTYNTIDDAYAEIYQQAGHSFYQITFPTENATWVYDLDIGDKDKAWHQRKTGDDAHLMATVLFYKGKLYVGDRRNTKLYTLDLDKYSDNGELVKRERIGRHNEVYQERLRYDMFELELETGVGLTESEGQGSDPKILLDWSDDGGHTWENTIHLDGPGIGEYRKRVLYHHMGMARDRVFRVRVSDPIKWVIKEAYVTVEQMAH